MQIIIIFETIILLLFVLRTFIKKTDGKLIVDEARDSWTVTIATNPEEIKKRKVLRLKIELK